MDINMVSQTQKKNGLPLAHPVMPGAERREAERSEADRSAAPGITGARPAAPAPPDPEVVADAKRRRFTAEYKLGILAIADSLKTSGGIGALLRSEKLYSSHLVTWRKEREAALGVALTPKTRGPKSQRDPHQDELDRLSREIQRLTESLRKAEIVIDIQKKVGSLLGWTPLAMDTREIC
jgi:transposase